MVERRHQDFMAEELAADGTGNSVATVPQEGCENKRCSCRPHRDLRGGGLEFLSVTKQN